jgi:hypothetical protein
VARRRGHLAQETRSPEVEVNVPEPEKVNTGEEAPVSPELQEQIDQELRMQGPGETEEGEWKKKPEAEPSLFDGERIVKAGFDGIAAFTSWEGWKLDPKDPADKDFLEAADRMITKHAPQAVGEYGDELMFAVSTIGAIGPRIKGYRAYLEAEKPKPPPKPIAAEPAKVDQTPAASEIPPVTAPPETGPLSTKTEEPKSIGGDKMLRRLSTKF